MRPGIFSGMGLSWTKRIYWGISVPAATFPPPHRHLAVACSPRKNVAPRHIQLSLTR